MAELRVFVGTDERGGRGEIVMEHGIRRHAAREVDVIHMRPGGTFAGQTHWEEGDWNRGRVHAVPYSGEGWATNFTCFRFGIPELAGFEGRAIYCDADQTVHSDVHELANIRLEGRPAAMRVGVIVFDCGHPFWRSHSWPTLREMKKGGPGIGYYEGLMRTHGATGWVPVEWDVLDGCEMSPYEAKLNHYTDMYTQPYHPFPDRFRYPLHHPNVDCDLIWWRSYREALAARLGVASRERASRLGATIGEALEMEGALGLDAFGRTGGYAYHFTEWSTLQRQASEFNPQGWRGSTRDRGTQELLELL